MLRQQLIHPPLLEALAAAGHGSTVLLADGNYPHATGVSSAASRVFLNLRPGQVPVDDVLETVLTAIPVEAAHVMQPADRSRPSVFDRYTRLLPTNLRLRHLSRADFYAAARGPDLAVVVATGDQRLYANILLTVGVMRPHGHEDDSEAIECHADSGEVRVDEFDESAVRM